MIITTRAIFVLGMFFYLSPVLACEPPPPITIPNGADATEAEMADAGARYHQFMLDNQLYQVCLEKKAKQARLQSKAEDKAEIRLMEASYSDRHNAASAAMTKTTERFERAVAAFKTARQSE